jgi:hypothetical protein
MKRDVAMSGIPLLLAGLACLAKNKPPSHMARGL